MCIKIKLGPSAWKQGRSPGRPPLAPIGRHMTARESNKHQRPSSTRQAPVEGAGLRSCAFIASPGRARIAQSMLMVHAGKEAILCQNLTGLILTSIPKHALQRFFNRWGGTLVLYQCDGKHGKPNDHNGDQHRDSCSHFDARLPETGAILLIQSLSDLH